MENKDAMWEKARNLLVFYVYTTPDEFNLFKKTLEQNVVDSNIKETKVVIVMPDRNEDVAKHSLYTYFSEKDISLFGKIKKKNKVIGDIDLQALKDKQFDLFICFGTPSNKILKWLKDFKFYNRISVNCEKQEYFTLNFKSSLNSIQEMINFATATLKKIS